MEHWLGALCGYGDGCEYRQRDARSRVGTHSVYLPLQADCLWSWNLISWDADDSGWGVGQQAGSKEASSQQWPGLLRRTSLVAKGAAKLRVEDTRGMWSNTGCMKQMGWRMQAGRKAD